MLYPALITAAASWLLILSTDDGSRVAGRFSSRAECEAAMASTKGDAIGCFTAADYRRGLDMEG